MHHNEERQNRVEAQQKLYLAYAQAAESYGKKPTIFNWEKKEKAFELYNAFLKVEEKTIA